MSANNGAPEPSWTSWAQTQAPYGAPAPPAASSSTFSALAQGSTSNLPSMASTSYRSRDDGGALERPSSSSSSSMAARMSHADERESEQYRSDRRQDGGGGGSHQRSTGMQGYRESPEPGQITYPERPSSHSRDSDRDRRDRERDRDRDRDWDRQRDRDRNYRPQLPPPPRNRSRGSSPDSDYRPSHSRVSGGTSSMVQSLPNRPRTMGPSDSGGANGGSGGGGGKGKGREGDGDEDLAKAMQGFARTLQSTLEASSSHALASDHHTRLSTFLPSAPPKSTPASANLSASLDRSKKRVEEAEKTLYDNTIALEGAFVDLMRHAMGKSGHLAFGSGASKQEIQALQSRIEELEKQDRSAAPDAAAQAGPSRPRNRPAADGDIDMYEAAEDGQTPQNGEGGEGNSHADKRVRLRTLINGIRTRLDMVTMSHREMDERYEDLQSQIWARDESRIDKVRLGIGKKDTPRRPGSWEELERRRDPTGALRGIEVPQAAEEEKQDGVGEEGAEVATLASGQGGGADEAGAAGQAGSTAQEGESGDAADPGDAGGAGEVSADEETRGAQLDESGRIVGGTIGFGDPAQKEEVEMLRAQVLELQGDIGRLVSERDAREKELVESVMEKMKVEAAALVEESIAKAIAAMKARSAEIPAPAPAAAAAPPASTTPRLPDAPLSQATTRNTNVSSGPSSEPISAATAHMSRRASQNAPSGTQYTASPVQVPRQAASASPNLPTAGMNTARPANAASLAQQNTVAQWMLPQQGNTSYAPSSSSSMANNAFNPSATSSGTNQTLVPIDQNGYMNGGGMSGEMSTNHPQLVSTYAPYQQSSAGQPQTQHLANIHPTLLSKWTTFTPDQQRLILGMTFQAQEKVIQVAQGLRLKAFQEAQAQPMVQPKAYINMDVAILYALQHAMTQQ